MIITILLIITIMIIITIINAAGVLVLPSFSLFVILPFILTALGGFFARIHGHQWKKLLDRTESRISKQRTLGVNKSRFMKCMHAYDALRPVIYIYIYISRLYHIISYHMISLL